MAEIAGDRGLTAPGRSILDGIGASLREGSRDDPVASLAMEGLPFRGARGVRAVMMLLVATFAAVAVAACGGAAAPPANDQTTVTVSPPSGSAAPAPAH